MSNKTHSDGTVTLGRPTKLPPGTRVIHNGDVGTIVEPDGWTMFDDEYRVQLDAAPGGYTRDWVLRADELTVVRCKAGTPHCGSDDCITHTFPND